MSAMSTRSGTVSGEAKLSWLSPEEFAALSSTAKDIYLYTICALLNPKLDSEAGEQQVALGQN